MPIDMWSLGCILAELLTGFPLLPGEDEADQLACIMELLGMPPQKLLDQSRRAKNFISSKGIPRYSNCSTMADGKFQYIILLACAIYFFNYDGLCICDYYLDSKWVMMIIQVLLLIIFV